MDGRPKGRAALKETLLRLRRPGEDEAPSVAPGSDAPAASAPVAPKPRGRAELFQKLKQQVRPATEAIVQTKIEPTPSTPTTQIKQIEKPLAHLQIQEAEFKKAEKGTSGSLVGIHANYLRLIREEDKGFHKYEVKFDPEIDSLRARVVLLRTLMRTTPELGDVYMFNGGIDFFLPFQLARGRLVAEVVHPFDPETTVTLTIIYKRMEPFGSRDSISAINVLFKRVMNKLKLKAIGRNYFDMDKTVKISQYALTMIPGYAVAVDAMEGGLMICLDTCHKLLRQKNVLEVLAELRKNDPANFKEKAYEELLGQTVLTEYNDASYIIDDIVWEANPTNTFETASGPISYVDYFKKRHGREIKSMSQPLLLNMKKKKTGVAGQEEEFRVCLIPELSNLTGISQDMLSHKFRKDIAGYTRLTPAQRFERLKQYIHNVKSNPEASKLLKDWGFTLDDGMIDLNARVLTDNKITFRNKRYDVAEVPEWSREIGRDNLINPIDMTSWLVVYPQNDESAVMNFVKDMCGLARGFGCRIDKPKFVAIPGKCHDSDYRRALDANANDHVQIILLVMPMARESLYTEIKSCTLCRKGILSQGVLSRTLANKKIIRSVTLKLGLQMQAKLGGSLWAIIFPSVCKDFMFCGIDTYHSKCNKKSVGALVCSIDERHTRFFTGLAFQAHEVADALKLQFQQALECRKKMTGNYPSVVFMIRDGVGDGALQHVKNYEMQQYLNVSKETGANFKMVFVVIQKRINTRFMLHNGRNPGPGTVLDHTITRRQYDDYYLVPQTTNQGTVSPCHYIVLHNDTTILNLDKVQKLTYKLCHLYYNWSGAVSVPAPCQYAHKAAYLAGQFLERKPDQRLVDKLYYL